MKNRKAVLVFTCTIILIMIAVIQCKDPEEFEPDDPYRETPAPPHLIAPQQDTFFPCGGTYAVTFDWTDVPGATVYEHESDTSPDFSTAKTEVVNEPPATISFFRYHFRTTYYWRVRAGSALWIDPYTDWSDIWTFDLIPEGIAE
jgi:hypothetical protein